MTNSVRHGGVLDETGSVTLTVSATGQKVRVEVRDSGAQGTPPHRSRSIWTVRASAPEVGAGAADPFVGEPRLYRGGHGGN